MGNDADNTPISLAEVKKQPIADLVDELRLLHALAAEGGVRGLAIAYVVDSAEVCTFAHSGDAHFADLFLAVAQLQRSMLGAEDG